VKTVGPGLDISEAALNGAGGGDFTRGTGLLLPKAEPIDLIALQDLEPETPDLAPHSSTNLNPEYGVGEKTVHLTPASGGSTTASGPPSSSSGKKAVRVSATAQAGVEEEPKMGILIPSDLLRLSI
jgi:hypothetical protein